MAFRQVIIIFIFALAVFGTGCGDAATNTASNSNISNSNAVRSNSNSPVAASTPAPEQTTNAAPTLKPVFSSYCAAMERKDEAGIRRVYSKDTIEIFEKEMKAEGSKTLAQYLSVDQVTTALCEIRNEVITGNEAVAEVKTAGMPNGAKVVFVKEGNDWKLTNRSPALDVMKQTASNNNSEK